jgi:CRP-like cAMP-binding protein
MRKVDCEMCPLRANAIFRDFTADELAFVTRFKSGELTAEAGSTILSQGSSSAYVFTALSGWGMRYKDLEDGRRQILNYVFPGELVGLQGALLREMEHSVQALTDMVLCVFERARMWELYARYPSLAYDITWLAAREEKMLEEHLFTVGQRTARERLAYLVLHIFDRARRLGMTDGEFTMAMPLTQQHMADSLGLSLVHTNKTLRHLYNDRLIEWKRRSLTILDPDGLKDAASWSIPPEARRPLI